MIPVGDSLVAMLMRKLVFAETQLRATTETQSKYRNQPTTPSRSNLLRHMCIVENRNDVIRCPRTAYIYTNLLQRLMMRSVG